MAYSNMAQKRKARRSLAALQSLRGALGTGYGIGFGTAPVLLNIAELLLLGDIAGKARDFDKAVSALERASRLEDSLRYNEPPDWYFPTRHVLGSLLLDAGYPREAAVIYWEDLRKNPANGYSLFGLRQALAAQGDDTAAAKVASLFEIAWSQADVELSSSRF